MMGSFVPTLLLHIKNIHSSTSLYKPREKSEIIGSGGRVSGADGILKRFCKRSACVSAQLCQDPRAYPLFV